MAGTIAVKGLDTLNAKLKALGEDVRTDVAKKGLTAAGEIVSEQAKANAPRGRTGGGAEAIGFALKDDEGYPAVSVGIHPGIRASAKKGFYLAFAETGTGPRQTKGGANRGAMPIRPWLRPALDAKLNEARDAVAKEVDAAIQRQSE